MKFNVTNCPSDLLSLSTEYPYTVIRSCDNKFWYYQHYKYVEIASKVATQLGNGLVVLTVNINIV